MIGAHRIGWLNFTVGQSAQMRYERKLMFSRFDFAAEQSGVGSVFLCFPEHLKCVEGRSGRSAKDADHDGRIVADELLKCCRTEIRNLEEHWPRAQPRPGK